MSEGPTIGRFAARELLRRRIREGDSYGLLLAAIIVTYVLMVFLDGTAWGRVALGVAFGGVLLLALYTSRVRGRMFKIAGVVVVVAVAANALQGVLGSAYDGAGIATVALVVVAPVAVLQRIARHPRVNLESILGVICAYLLIGIAFASVYGLLNRLESDPFFAQSSGRDPVDYLYFSYIVLTTVGFGDLTPRTDTGRVLVTIEALMGQIFLVTVLAGLVGSFGRDRYRPQPERSGPPSEDAPRRA
ncbi:MAG TPA: potassium channel family protein [Acidimicrobiia bacterium]|nr:potassium channel family protein [Acidimicrobiia bacterium]